jgi:23S rRNA pseudouridine1911/1915/1917 synthase
MLLAHLAVEAPEHFGGDDVDALFGVDIALAKWEDPRATNPGFLAACVLRASGLDEAERRAADAPPAGSRAKKNLAHPVDRAVSAARGRAASMFNLVLSSLDLRGGAHRASLCVLFDEMPSARVAPDVVSHALVAAACVAGGDDQGAAAALAAARRDAGAFASPSTKNKTPTGTHATESQLGMNIRVLYEDAHLLAVSKPAGVLTHEPSGELKKKKKKERDDTSVSSALVRLYGADGLSAVSARTSGPGIVHRLDRPTTGVVLVAKTDEAHLSLVAQWFQRRVKKTYLALTERHPGDVDKRRLKTKSRASAGTVVAPVDGKPALSDWRVVETFEGDASAPCALVEVRPLTGRKHQIRAHMGLERRAPLAGDPLYRNGQKSRVPACVEDALFFASSSETEKGSVGTGTARSKKKAKPASALFLHSKSIELEHPITGEALKLEDPPPPAFEAVLEALRKMEK